MDESRFGENREATNAHIILLLPLLLVFWAISLLLVAALVTMVGGENALTHRSAQMLVVQVGTLGGFVLMACYVKRMFFSGNNDAEPADEIDW